MRINLSQLSQLSKKKSKYSSEKLKVGGIVFHSKREGNRYKLLLLKQRQGLIYDLKRQVSFSLAPSFYIDVKVPLKTKTKIKKVCVHREMRYIADFTYYDENGNYVVEDVKGFRTKEYERKKNLMKRIYGIIIKET